MMNDKSFLVKPMVDVLLQAGADISDIQSIELAPKISPLDYQVAMKLADEKAQQTSGEVMLLSQYDRDRDFESPQHLRECHQDSAIPGYVDYGISHGAKLMVDIENGRFVFFYMPVSL